MLTVYDARGPYFRGAGPYYYKVQSVVLNYIVLRRGNLPHYSVALPNCQRPTPSRNTPRRIAGRVVCPDSTLRLMAFSVDAPHPGHFNVYGYRWCRACMHTSPASASSLRSPIAGEARGVSFIHIHVGCHNLEFGVAFLWWIATCTHVCVPHPGLGVAFPFRTIR